MADQKGVAAEVVDESNLSKKELKKLKKQEKKENKKEKKRGGFLKLVLFFIIIFGAIFAFLYFNIFGIRSTYVDDKIVGTPIESVFAGAPGADEESGGKSTGGSKAELQAQVDELTAQVTDLETQLEEAQDMNDLYVSQLDQLQPLAEEQLKFKEDKAEFDRMIAENDPEAFKAFYEEVYPDTAREVYEGITGNTQSNGEITAYVANFTAMDEDKAASILEIMAVTDIDLVVQILNNMSSEKSGTILAEMNPESAAGIAKRMAPTVN